MSRRAASLALERLEGFVDKSTDASKPSSEMRARYPTHVGKMDFDNEANPLTSLGKDDFIADVVNFLRLNEGSEARGLTLEAVRSTLRELHVENATGRFVVRAEDWP